MAVTQGGGGRERSPRSSGQGAPRPWGCRGAGRTPVPPPAFLGGRRCPGPPQTAGCGLGFADSSDAACLRFPKRSLTTAGSSQSGVAGVSTWSQPRLGDSARGALLLPSPLLWGAGRGPWVQYSPPNGRGEPLGTPHRERAIRVTFDQSST